MARILEVPLEGGRIDLRALMPKLRDAGIQSLLVEGGGTVAGAALAAGIVDRVAWFYAPKILGGDDGIPVLRGDGPERMSEAIRLEEVRWSRFETDFLVEGTPVPSRKSE